MEFEKMSIEELEEKRAELKAQIEEPDADLDALTEEVRAVVAEIEKRKAEEAKRVELRASVAAGAGTVIEKIKEEKRDMLPVEEVRKSPEYVEAFANYIKTGDDKECRALLSTNVSGGQVPVPTIIEGRIRTAWERSELMSLVRKTYIRGNVKVGFELSATGALVHTEGSTAPTEEVLTFGIVSLTPQSIKKWISISDEAMDMGGEEFLYYIYDEITYQIAKKAEQELLGKITALTASATSTAVGVGITAGTPTVGIVATAVSMLSDEAANPVVVINKQSYAAMKNAQYANKFNVDPFENLPVYFNNSLPAYTTSGTTGAAWMIVGDFGQGAQANFPNGDEITLKYDELSLAEQDLVKIVGREYIGLGIVADHAFCKVTF